MNWKPSATIETLKQRAAIIDRIRQFFKTRGLLEVETPLLYPATVTDQYLQSIRAGDQYLQTSPEFCMKRLIAAGSGPIFQICKAFRDDEIGRQHNPEFTMLEWYQPGFDHHDLMDEMDEFLQDVINSKNVERLSYQDIFLKFTDINPHTSNTKDLKILASQFELGEVLDNTASQDDWLFLIMSHVIEPKLGFEQPTFIYDFPVTQAALAKIRHGDIAVAERFEVYIQGVEIANGFNELADSKEQLQRFESENSSRANKGLEQMPIDHKLIAALEHFPQCAGVALGVDRLVMLATANNNLQDCLAFPAFCLSTITSSD